MIYRSNRCRARHASDTFGHIVEVDETTADGTTTLAYSYDLIGQLVGVEASGAQTHSHTYTYDANGNRTSVTNGIDTLTAGDIDHDADDRLLSYGSVTFDYDDAGRWTERTEGVGVTTYDYGVSGELRQVDTPTSVVEYEHDALRRRIARKVDGSYTHRWLYADRLNPIAEVDANGETVSTFVYGTGINVPDYMVRGGATYYFVRDHLGSVRFVVDADTGDVGQELRYDEFGNVTLDTNPGFQPFGYAGGLYDPETSLVRFGARDYDARTGRWTAPDPIGFGGGQANLYVYVTNSPVQLLDPSGRLAFSTIVIIVLAAGVVNAAGSVTVYDAQTSACRRTARGYLAAGVAGFAFGAGLAAALVAAGGVLIGGLAVETATLVAFGGTTGVKLGLLSHAFQVALDPNLAATSQGFYSAGQTGGVNGVIAGGLGPAMTAQNASVPTQIGVGAMQEALVSGYHVEAPR